MNKKGTRFLVLVVLLSIFGLKGCLPEIDYPETPVISFASITFSDVPDINKLDTLSLTINFTDGDGDLGLSSQSEDNYFPFNRKYFFFWSSELGIPVKYSSVGLVSIYTFFKTSDDRNNFINEYLGTSSRVLLSYPTEPYALKFPLTESLIQIIGEGTITYSDKMSIPELDSLPSFTDPFNCMNWELAGTPVDTFYYQSNQHHNNIIIDFFIDHGNGEFVQFDFETDLYKYPNCNTNYDGRFPIINTSEGSRSLEGKIKYNMTSRGFTNVFGIKRMKIRAFILDRSLKRSNIIETPPFRLDDIKK